MPSALRCAVLCIIRSVAFTVSMHQAASRGEGETVCLLVLLEPFLAAQHGIQLMLL